MPPPAGLMPQSATPLVPHVAPLPINAQLPHLNPSAFPDQRARCAACVQSTLCTPHAQLTSDAPLRSIADGFTLFQVKSSTPPPTHSHIPPLDPHTHTWSVFEGRASLQYSPRKCLHVGWSRLSPEYPWRSERCLPLILTRGGPDVRATGHARGRDRGVRARTSCEASGASGQGDCDPHHSLSPLPFSHRVCYTRRTRCASLK
jgi:hypothetical protein